MLKRPEFSFRNTIFIRLVTTFMLIMLPIILLGVYIYQWSIRTASDDISKTAVSQISFYLGDLENEIERMKLLQYGLIEDTDLNMLAITWETMGDIERMEKITSVLNRIFSLQNSSNYIHNVSVHIRPISKTLSSINGAGEFDGDRYRAIRADIEGQGAKFIQWEGNLLLSAAKPSGMKGREPLFTIDIELDSRKLRQALQQFNTYAGSSALLLSGRQGFVLGSGSVNALDGEARRLISGIDDGGSGTVTLQDERYFVSHAYSDRLDMSIYRFIPEQIVRKPLDKFYTLAWFFAAGAFVIIAVYALSTYKFIHKPMLRLVKGFRRLESGDLKQAIDHKANDEFRYIYSRFNKMVVNLRTLIDQAYKQKIMAQRAELKQLQSQINPHFLYNSFFILNTMAKVGDTDRIEQFTTQLGEYFQFVTRNASDEVTLGQEVHHARMYTEIQELRFSRRIKVRFDELPAELVRVVVPRLIVQPIIENAFEHSLEKMTRDGIVEIRFERSKEWACIVIEDNGDRLTDEKLMRISSAIAYENEKSETTGIVNIHRRIVITYGEGSGLRVARGQLGGLKVTIRVPLKGVGAIVQIADR
ncbi:sensor histidine kinase [Cohnella lupini]|uniref:Two-component system sensor histidine kinase YesM n=1 Tax=Cohnella lupini TaxID=1294267 RepID=A0A3D9IJ94_9BACL|nr:histidine kinase [Cohnella lupini]RED61864.1 two-component system sensor histidine kinase YesM [Cohnella lupini]